MTASTTTQDMRKFAFDMVRDELHALYALSRAALHELEPPEGTDAIESETFFAYRLVGLMHERLERTDFEKSLLAILMCESGEPASRQEDHGHACREGHAMFTSKTPQARPVGTPAHLAPAGLVDRQRQAAANSRATAARRASSSKPRTAKTMPLPATGVSDNVLSFQYGLSGRDRAAVVRALRIVGGELRRADVMDSAALAKQYVNLQLAGERCEKFAVLHLDSQNRALAFDIMFTGTLTQTSVYPREIVRAALAHGSNAVVLAHNHPGGNVKPSAADHRLTQTLQAALALVDIQVLDHIIVGPGGAALSMAEHGMLQ